MIVLFILSSSFGTNMTLPVIVCMCFTVSLVLTFSISEIIVRKRHIYVLKRFKYLISSIASAGQSVLASLPGKITFTFTGFKFLQHSGVTSADTPAMGLTRGVSACIRVEQSQD